MAMACAIKQLLKFNVIGASPLRHYVAAISVGIVDGVPMLDLCYEEDSRADVDMNVVMTSGGEFVELQASAEGDTFDREQFDAQLRLAQNGIEGLIAAQRDLVTL